MNVHRSNIHQVEMNSLLDALYQYYGYDYRDYAKQSVLNRLLWRQKQWQLNHLSEIIPLILHSESHLQVLLSDLSITVTEMFRDPQHLSELVRVVFPYLQTFPFFKVWHAGCATGEEVYSFAMLLYEHGLLDRAQIYATDFNPTALKKAKQAIYNHADLDKYTEQYHQAGGQAKLENYFQFGYGNMKIKDELTKNIIFSKHNLVADGAFGVMELIVCRNVLIYFNPDLKKRVINLFSDSLYHNGYLFLGNSEALDTEQHKEFSVVNRKARLYRSSPELHVTPKAQITECVARQME